MLSLYEARQVLISYQDDHLLLFTQMRTGNLFQDIWTLREGTNEIQAHEYAEFRLGELILQPPRAHLCAKTGTSGSKLVPGYIQCPSAHGVVQKVTFAVSVFRTRITACYPHRGETGPYFVPGFTACCCSLSQGTIRGVRAGLRGMRSEWLQHFPRERVVRGLGRGGVRGALRGTAPARPQHNTRPALCGAHS